MIDLDAIQKGQPLRHKYGGYYRFDRFASEEGVRKAVYDHVWPHPPGGHIRTLDAFAAAFTAISEEELQKAVSGAYGDVETVRAKIQQAKDEARRNRV